MSFNFLELIVFIIAIIATLSSLVAMLIHIASQKKKNPFFPNGLPLPIDAPSYVERECDHQLATALETEQFIAITGEYRIGKSSLLMRVMQAPFFVRERGKNCYMDFQSMRTDNTELFLEEFFKSVSKSLGKEVISWQDNILTNQAIVFRLDEFGLLTDDIATKLIPPLYSLSRENNNLRVIVCLPELVDNFLKKTSINNPKYLTAWKNISVKSFEEKEILQLLSLLPKPVAQVAEAQYDTVLKLSSGKPLGLQCLCDKLFKTARNNPKTEELIATINDQDNYK
ncbi:MAG: hypothetical protein ABFS56_26445 [Pseudomonadota bacterium]